jgi:single-strand DNA-binding protein
MEMNQVEIEGGVVNEVDVGFTASGRAWCRFTLAVPDVVYNPKERREQIATHFISCQAWGYVAEQLIAGDPQKGEKLYVRGKLDQSEYEDNQGKKQSKTRVQVIAFQFTNRLARVTAGL